MVTGELLGKPNKLRGSDLRWTSIPDPGEVEILLAALCYRKRDKLWQRWARLGSKASHLNARWQT